MRTQLYFELKCSVCGSLLEADSDPGEDVKRTKHSPTGAQYHTASMAIRPCPTCMTEARKPTDLMREAVRLLTSDD